MTRYLWLRRAYQVVFLALFLFFVVVSTAPLLRNHHVEFFLGLDPLIAVSTALATRSLHPSLWWSLPLVALTLFFGRFFCGWICPMGVLHHALGFLARKRRVKDRLKQNAPFPAQKVKYVILVVMLAMAALGSVQVGLLDPIASTWRGLTTTVIPAASNTAFGIYQGERHFQFGPLLALVFFGALALNFVVPRFYCRVLCPLGALLGLFSKFSLFRIAKNKQLCTDCGACGADCAGAADPQGIVKATECMVCLNCVQGACPRNAIEYKFLPSLELSTEAVDLGRRRWLTAAASGFAAVPILRASDGVEPRPSPKRIRPPGALDEPEFLERCVKCGACMKICPTGGLQPALAESGLEGLWTPVLVPRIGYCEHSCTLCGEVCPTGAIAELTLIGKLGIPNMMEPVRIGSAAFDKGRCLPWAYDTECIVCEEVCPTAQKAIYFKLETVTARDGAEKTLKRPFVDLQKCVGCGTCEARCPVYDQAAVRVTSVGESRSAKNRIILSGGRV